MRSGPPAFQFYAKDWLASRTVRLMSYEDRGIYIELLCLAWDSDDPGTLTLPVAGANPRTIRSFLLRWPRCFVSSGAEFDLNLSPTEAERRLNEGRKEAEEGLKFTNHKLRENWVNYCEIREKRIKAGQLRQAACAEHVVSSAPASSPSPAPKTKNKNIRAFAYSPEFEQVWAAYPRKIGKGAAYKAFQKSDINGNLPELIASIEAHKLAWHDPQFIPHLETYLNKRRWEDQPDPASKPSTKYQNWDEQRSYELLLKAEKEMQAEKEAKREKSRIPPGVH